MRRPLDGCSRQRTTPTILSHSPYHHRTCSTQHKTLRLVSRGCRYLLHTRRSQIPTTPPSLQTTSSPLSTTMLSQWEAASSLPPHKQPKHPHSLTPFNKAASTPLLRTLPPTVATKATEPPSHHYPAPAPQLLPAPPPQPAPTNPLRHPTTPNN
jgi:hypothetical protein